MALDFLSKELGEQCYSMHAFLSIGLEAFVGLNLITKKFGWCFLKKHGQKYMVHTITFILDITMKD